MGFNSVTAGFSQCSCTVKLRVSVSVVFKGAWLLVRRADLIRCDMKLVRPHTVTAVPPQIFPCQREIESDRTGSVFSRTVQLYVGGILPAAQHQQPDR